MMKKFSKLVLLAATLAFTAGLAGCFVSTVEDDGPDVRTVTLADLKLGDGESLTDVAVKDPTIVSIEAGGSAKAVAAARAAAAITSFTITPKKQGSTHIILTVTGGDTDTLYLPVTVSSDLKLTLGTVTDKEPEESAGGDQQGGTGQSDSDGKDEGNGGETEGGTGDGEGGDGNGDTGGDGGDTQGGTGNGGTGDGENEE